MKRILLGAAAAAMALTGFAASAQPYGHYGYSGGYARGGYEGGWNRGDWNRGGWNGRGDWNHNRYGYGYGHSWRAGQYYSDYRRHDRMISDWGRYRLPPPRPGYAYYRDDGGDVVMAALASGLIGLVIGDALSDQGRYVDQGSYGYQTPYAYDYPY